MVNKEIAPTACSGWCSGTSRMLPLQPNHIPPFWRNASSTPAARPPAVASPSWIGATRLETTTRRDMTKTLQQRQDDRLRLNGLSPGDVGSAKARGAAPKPRQGLCPWTPPKAEALCNLSIGGFWERANHDLARSV